MPYRLTVEFYPSALDTDPSAALGIYETEGANVRLEFGDYVFETVNSEVRVWSGEKGFYGFTSGNEDAFSAHGLNVGPYAIYLSILDAAHPSLAPTDALKWVRSEALDLVGAPYFFLANQDYLDLGPDPIRIQGGVGTLSVTEVPEPRAWLLWLGGLALCFRRRKRAAFARWIKPVCVIGGCALLGGCMTTIQNGAFRVTTPADASHLVITGPGVTFDATGLSHSRPTRAAFAGASHLVSSVATAALPFVGGVTAPVKAAAILPALVPSFRTEPQPLR